MRYKGKKYNLQKVENIERSDEDHPVIILNYKSGKDVLHFDSTEIRDKVFEWISYQKAFEFMNEFFKGDKKK